MGLLTDVLETKGGRDGGREGGTEAGKEAGREGGRREEGERDDEGGMIEERVC